MAPEDCFKHFFEIVNRRDLDALGDGLTEDAEFYFPKTQPLRGRNKVIRFFKILFRQFPKLDFEVQRVIIQGQIGAVHWKNSGVNRKQEPYDNEGVTLLEMRGDKIGYISDFFKDTGKF
jgi:ketosteroid isomerase-like protein